MDEKILELLKESGAAGWEVTDTVKEGWEFYFIRHELDQNRIVDTEHITVCVYESIGDGKELGSARMEIPAGSEESEVRDMIAQLRREASLVKNPYYELHHPGSGVPESQKAIDPAVIAEDFIRTMTELPETESEDINSYEIFTSSMKRRFINSNGIDVTSVYPESMIEVVVNARKDGHEIELYRNYTSGTCDAEMLKKDLAETMQMGRDRLNAVSTPALGSGDLVLAGPDAAKIYEYMTAHLSSDYIYRRFSDWAIGTEAVKEVKGDRFTVKSVAHLKNSSHNTGYDSEGAAVRDLVLMNNNVPEAYCGSQQCAYYLGLKDCFRAQNYEICGGSRSAEELRSGNYLEVAEFSDFQVNPMTGDLAGEIRLGYLHQDGKVKIVTGGSVSGNMHVLMKEMYGSKEQRQYDTMVIPAVTRLCHVQIAGAE